MAWRIGNIRLGSDRQQRLPEAIARTEGCLSTANSTSRLGLRLAVAGQHPGGNQAIGHGLGRLVAGQLPGGAARPLSCNSQSAGGLKTHADRRKRSSASWRSCGVDSLASSAARAADHASTCRRLKPTAPSAVRAIAPASAHRPSEQPRLGHFSHLEVSRSSALNEERRLGGRRATSTSGGGQADDAILLRVFQHFHRGATAASKPGRPLRRASAIAAALVSFLAPASPALQASSRPASAESGSRSAPC